MKNTFKFPKIPIHWQQFFLCILFHMLLPLLAIGLEFWFTSKITVKSLMLVAALYSISIGVSSENLLLFGLSIFIGIIFSAAYGYTTTLKTAPSYGENFALYTIIAMFIMHTTERWNMHVADRRPYFKFLERRK